MSGCFFSGEAAAKRAGNERGSTTTILLLVLLLVIAAGGYLYYFTDLIRPKAPQKPQQAQNVPVKQPIPPRPVQPPAVPSPAPALPGAPPAAPSAAATPGKSGPAVATTVQPAVPPPAPAAVPGKALPSPAKPASVPAKPAAVPVKPAAVPVKPAAAPVKPAAAPVKPAAAPVKPAAAPVKPAAAPVKPAAAPAKTAFAKKPVRRNYALQIGDFVPDETLAAVEAKLRKNGIAPVKRKVVAAQEPMKRLFVEEFGDQDSAEAGLQKLKSKTADAFLVANGSKYDLYAGSYFSERRLRSQLKQLSGKGVTPTVKQVRVAIKVTRLTAGRFATAAEAGGAVKRLHKMGIRAKVVKIGR